MKRKHRVLILEDDAPLLSGIKEIFEMVDYTVMTAHNGVEGLTVLGEQIDNPPDIIVSDITMPYMDGFHFLEEVRKQDRWVKIPFIFLTAHGERPDRRKGALLGADVYLTKPFNVEDLLVQVSARIDRHKQIEGAGERDIDGKIDVIRQNILNTLSYEFRTPLTIDAYAELFHEFQRNSMDTTEVMNFLKGVNISANRLRRVVENFITLVELDSDDVRRTYAWRRRPIVSLFEHVIDAYQQVTASAAQSRIFECNIAEDLPQFTADAQLMTIAIRELLDNAVKYSSDDSRFILNAQQVGDWIEIQVQDFGRGLPKNEFENVWRPFYQYDPDNIETQSAGSGLAIVDGILKIHGGSRSVTSDGSKGSIFTMRLPVQAPVLTLRNGQTGGVNTMKRKYRVLVVEDDAHLLSGIKEILEIEEYVVITAHNGIEGLRVLGEQGDQLPNLIVSDIGMPYMDGFHFLEEVRKHDQWVKIPFIFLTAHGERADQNKGVQLGADEYLTKPFNAEDLVLRVESRIRRYERMQEIEKQNAEQEIVDVKRKILTILNHEFRTPLTLVVAYAELLKEFDPESMNEDDVMTFLKGVNSGANRLRRLVENFITLVELESGDITRTYEWRRRPIVSLYDHVMEAHQQITYPDETPRAFECHVADNIPEFVADAQMMTMAIRELLDNAAKFTPVDQHFVLKAHCVGEWIEIQVQDFGRGLPESEFEKVWAPFYQFERDKFEHQGAGSGLAIVQGIVDIHGGTRSVSSVEGKGSTFTIRLPMQPSPVLPRIGD